MDGQLKMNFYESIFEMPALRTCVHQKAPFPAKETGPDVNRSPWFIKINYCHQQAFADGCLVLFHLSIS